MTTHLQTYSRMYNPETHVSINQQTEVLKSIFPPEIVNIIEYYVIKMEGFTFKNVIYLRALELKNKRNEVTQHYMEMLWHQLEMETKNANSMYEAMIREGIDPNNPAYIPICRQMAICSPLPIWWEK